MGKYFYCTELCYLEEGHCGKSEFEYFHHYELLYHQNKEQRRKNINTLYHINMNGNNFEYMNIYSYKDNISPEEIKNKIAKFSDEKFGIDRPYTAPLHHLKEEVNETIESGEIEEYADMLLLILDSFRKKYPNKTTQELLNCCDRKIENVLYKREWNKPDENGVFKHIK